MVFRTAAREAAAVVDQGLIGDDGWLSDQGRAVRQRVEALTDDLAAKTYECLEAGELDELMAALEPLAALLVAAQEVAAETERYGADRPPRRR